MRDRKEVEDFLQAYGEKKALRKPRPAFSAEQVENAILSDFIDEDYFLFRLIFVYTQINGDYNL